MSRLLSPRSRSSRPTSRRSFLQLAGPSALMVPGCLAMPRLSRAAARPLVTHGLQSGDVGTNRGVLWARTDRPARAVFQVSTTEGFKKVRTLPYLDVLPDTDYTAKLLVED